MLLHKNFNYVEQSVLSDQIEANVTLTQSLSVQIYHSLASLSFVVLFGLDSHILRHHSLSLCFSVSTGTETRNDSCELIIVGDLIKSWYIYKRTQKGWKQKI